MQIFPGINIGIVVMEDKLQNSISTDELYKEYNWYQNTFPELVQNSCDDFFEKNFDIKFIGLSKNINCLLNNESCFVTKVKIDEDYDMFFRLTDRAIDIILSKALGASKTKFNINKISELEAKIITTFNSSMFDSLKEKLNKPEPAVIKRTNFDVIHLTFLIKDLDEYNKDAGKIILSLPQALLAPESVTLSEEKFSETDFPASETTAKIIVGKTKFSLYDLKNLEEDDLVVFENSKLSHLRLSLQGEEMDVKITPNMDLLIPETNDGGEEMSDTHKNIWDTIEVEMNAEFDAVKITLGELKSIEEGLVVDLTSLYDNNVTLKVEGKAIASGSLVIINDRYGVKVNNVIAQNSGASAPARQNNNIQEDEDNYSQPEHEEESFNNDEISEDNYSQESNAGEDEEEFDYSDFELEDENI